MEVYPQHLARPGQVYRLSCSLGRFRTILASLWPYPIPHSHLLRSAHNISIWILWRLCQTYFLSLILHGLDSVVIIACYDPKWLALRSPYLSFLFQSLLDKLGGFGIHTAPVCRLSHHFLAIRKACSRNLPPWIKEVVGVDC